jgi:hypothetical protein
MADLWRLLSMPSEDDRVLVAVNHHWDIWSDMKKRGVWSELVDRLVNAKDVEIVSMSWLRGTLLSGTSPTQGRRLRFGMS